MSDKQCTIGGEVAIKGIGLHTGEVANIKFKPGAENTGYWFIRTDIEGGVRIKADVDNVVDTSRGTTIEVNGARVYTIEHALAAVYGLGIDNIEIEIDGPEVPILDGSAQPFVDILLQAGIVEQEADKNYYVLTENLTYEDEEKQCEMLAVPQDEFRLTVMVDYNSKILGTQHASMYHLGEFKDEIAPCRTFVFLKDNGECCFGGDPKPYDMMEVRMTGDQTTRAYTGMIAVSGTLNADVRAEEGEPVYIVDADIVEEAQTSF